MDLTAVFSSVSMFFDIFGSPIIVAVILFVINLAFGVKPKNAFMSAMFAGIGLMGFMWLINEYIPIVVPAVISMIQNTGINLPAIDTGWAAVAMVAYSTEAGMVYLVLGTVFQLILFLTKFTNVFQPSGVWDQYSYAIWGSMVYFVTKDFLMAVVFMLILNLYVTLMYEALAKRWSTYYGYQNCTIVQLHHGMGVPFGILWSWLLNKLGANKVNWQPTNIRERFGFWGDPIVMGVIVGFALGIAGNWGNLGTMEGWGSVIAIAVGTAATMAIFPRVAAIFAQAFTHLAAASRKFAKDKNRDEVYIGVDDASGYGETATLLGGTLFIPIYIILTLVWPGNLFLPLGTLVGFPFTFNVYTSLNNGNIFKSLISATLTYMIGFSLASPLFATWTQIYNNVPGIDPIAEGALAGNGFFFGTIQNLMMRGVFNWGWVMVAILFIAYWPLHFWFKKNKVKIVDFVEKQALLSTADIEELEVAVATK